MSNEVESHYEYAQKINSIIGTLSWQDEVCALTKEFLDLTVRGIADDKVEDIVIRNILKFCEQAIAFDQEQVKEYFINNANASQILELGLSIRALNCTDLLKDYLIFIYDHKEVNQQTKDQIENFVVHYAIQIWPHLEINDLTDWAIEGKFKNVLMNAVLYYPYHHMAMEDNMEEVLTFLLADKDWLTYAKIFVKYPGMIQEYDNEFSIKEVLSDSSEKNHEAISRWVSEIYDAAPADSNLHVGIINLFNNSYLSNCFMRMVEESFNAMQEMDVWNKEPVRKPTTEESVEQPQQTEG